jgi:hypothetical protein
MGRTYIRQDIQIRESDIYEDNIIPSAANYETNPANIEDDFNSLRSQVNNLMNLQTGNWYDDIAAPSTFEGGTERGINSLNQDLHDFEHKRVLQFRDNLTDIGPLGSVQGVVLASGELPTNTIAAIGSVATLGTVCATATVFATFSADDVVVGPNALSPKNLVGIVDATTRGPILDSGGKRIWGLFQSESAVDGSTLTGVTPNRAQISFVVMNATGDGFQLVVAVDMNGKSFNYYSVERGYLLTSNEQDFFQESGASDLTADQHKTLRQLIHFLDDGPGDGFSTNPYFEPKNGAGPWNYGGVWWESSLKLKKLAEKTVNRNANKTPSTVIWMVYAADGSLLITATDTYAYTGGSITPDSVTRSFS